MQSINLYLHRVIISNLTILSHVSRSASTTNTPKLTYTLSTGLAQLQQQSKNSHRETVEIAIQLKNDKKKKAMDSIRSTVLLPKGTGKTVRVLVFAQGEQADQCRQAGAVNVGGEEMVHDILKGTLKFDQCYATPDMMPMITRHLARYLGPRGLMPNTKNGTLTEYPHVLVSQSSHLCEFKSDKNGNIRCGIGRLDFDTTDLLENIMALLFRIRQLYTQPSATSKQVNPRSISSSSSTLSSFHIFNRLVLSSTQGPGLLVSTAHPPIN